MKATSCGLRVAMFAPERTRCGVSDYSRNLIDALRRRPEVAELEVVGAPSDAVRSGSADAVLHFPADEARFRALGECLNAADVAHVQHQYFLFGGVGPHKNHARAFLDAIRVPVVMTVHEIAEPLGSPLERRAITAVSRANFLHPAIRRLIVHTHADVERLTRIGAAPDRSDVIRIGVPSRLPMPPAEHAKRRFGLEGRRVITLFGFISKKKGHLIAVETLKLLPNDACLLIAGERHPDDATTYVADVEALVHRLDLDERVKMTGFLPDAEIPFVMAATDVAIAPFVASSGSASLAHLFAYGVPIIASDIPPHVELVNEVANALLLTGSDPSALADVILNVLNDDKLRAALALGAAAYAKCNSFAAVAERTVSVYRKAND